jgi:hypothetical protein
MPEKKAVSQPATVQRGYQPLASNRKPGKPPRGGSGVPAAPPSSSQKQSKPPTDK